MKRHTAWLAVALACMPAIGAQAATIEEDAFRFGVRQSVLDVSLSPDGTKFAYIGPQGAYGEILYVVDLSEEDPVPKAAAYNAEAGSDLDFCDWATDERLICQAYIQSRVNGVLLGFTRLIAVSADGSDHKLLTVRNTSGQLGYRQNGGNVLALDYAEEEGNILMTRQWVKEFSTGTKIANEEEGLGVDRVDVVSASRRVLEGPDHGAVGYIADENGRVRIKIRHPRDSHSMLGDRRTYHFRTLDSDSWQPLSQIELDSQNYEGFLPVAADSGLNLAYGFERGKEYTALYSISLDGAAEKKLVLAHDSADVDQLIRIGRQRRVVGASYATEKRQIAYIDPELQQLSQQLQAALPGKPLINIVDASADESKLLIIASSDTDPGMVYLLDRKSKNLAELLPLRNELAGRTMAPMQPISFPAADGTQIPGYLTMPEGAEGPMPAIVLPHGGPSARDEWGFDWLVQFFAARGYAVLQPNFRGSSGYGDDWFGRNGFQQWRTAVGDVNDAGRWLVAQGIADPGRLAAVGWSYGGYAALQSQTLDPALYKAIVAIAPVTDLQDLKDESRVYTSYRLVADFVGDGPHVSEGSPAQNAAAFAAPVLLVHGTEDQNVNVAQSRLMKDRLEDVGKPVEYVEYEGLDHYLDDSGARANMLVKIDDFLARTLVP